MKPVVVGLDSFGLTKSTVRRLKDTPVTVEVHLFTPPYVYPSPSQFQKLLLITPQERSRLVREWRVQTHRKLREEFPFDEYKITYFNRAPAGLRATIPARDVEKLFKLRYADVVDILSVKGIRKKKVIVKPEDYCFYAVRALFAIQIEGQTSGLQTYEDRILLVKAADKRHAVRLAKREFRDYEQISLRTTGYFWRWHFERITDVWGTSYNSIGCEGTEVYSKLQDRRMKPEYEWHPAKSPQASSSKRKNSKS
ncbi:MAG: DUF4288 domain-containing protein [Candidatus Hydrogenedentes bacterium]|nr:DUF4288 domain-containing protein [Candidatus Hydrogenedentota bacterium]